MEQMLDLALLTDCHIRPGWVRTVRSSEAATATRVIAHLEPFHANTVDTSAAYVAICRAKEHAAIHTDSRDSLTEALGLQDGARVGAIDKVWSREKEPLIVTPALIAVAGLVIS